MSIELNNQQIYAVYDADNWWHKSSNQLFQITGGPGTGKSFLVNYIIERIGLDLEEVLFVAFMGKAATRLARQGLPARTIHSAIYDYVKVVARDEDGKIIFNDRGKPKTINKFVKKDKIGKKIKLIVVDEASMVDKKTAEDLLSFGIPVITLGDLNQLPPVFGNPYFLQNPDVRLTQIMRQSEGNPIVWLSNEVLSGNELKPGVYGKSAVIEKKDLNEYYFRNADCILTCTNRLRYNINTFMREEIKQIKKLDYPHIGEKIICRKNNWGKCIGDGIYMTNGLTGFVDYVYRESFNGKTMTLDFKPDFTNKAFKNVTFDYKHLYEIPGTADNNEQNFTSFYNDKIEFAYAITVHSCLSLDTLIYTEDGIKPIKDLNEYNGKVFNGTYWEKPSKYIDNGYDDIYKLEMDNGMEYNVTKNHKCKVLTSEGIVTKYGKDVEVGDAFLIRKNQNLYLEDMPYKFDNKYIYENIDTRTKYYTLPNEMSIKLAETIGMICADGTIYKRGIRYVKRHKECVEKFSENIFNLFGYKSKVMQYSYDEAWYTEVDSVLIKRFFYNMKGLRPNKKYVPKCILCSSQDYQCAFLRGLFEGGYVHLKNNKFDMIVLTFKNTKMKNQLATMLLNLGINCKISLRKKNKLDGSMSTLYDLYIFKHGAKIYREKIGFISNVKNNRLKEIVSDHERELNNELCTILCNAWRGVRNDDFRNIKRNKSLTPYIWNKLKPFINENDSLPESIFKFIDSIINDYYIIHVNKIDKYFDKTACLEMPETHVFLQNGILGGNSQGSDFNNCLFLAEDIMRNKEDKKKLWYTAITRAIDSIIIVI